MLRWVLLGCLVSVSAASAAENRHCFETHIREAIELNELRRPVYSKLSDGDSESVSRWMILMERFTLPVAKYFDWQASRLAGTSQPGLMCDEFMPMSATPALKEHVPPTHEIPAALESLSASALIDRIKSAHSKQGFPGVVQSVKQEIQAISAYPAYFCMTRHFLESIGRTARLADRYDSAGKELSMDFIRLQLFGLYTATRIDRLAAPVQQKGVAIICQDVPYIPIE